MYIINNGSMVWWLLRVFAPWLSCPPALLALRGERSCTGPEQEYRLSKNGKSRYCTAIARCSEFIRGPFPTATVVTSYVVVVTASSSILLCVLTIIKIQGSQSSSSLGPLISFEEQQGAQIDFAKRTACKAVRRNFVISTFPSPIIDESF